MNYFGAVYPGQYAILAEVTTPPEAPSDLIAVITSDYIELMWSDNSAIETFFSIERSTDGLSFTEIATVPANSESYQDDEVISGFHYFYRVRAANNVGFSDYSNVADATGAADSLFNDVVIVPWGSPWN